MFFEGVLLTDIQLTKITNIDLLIGYTDVFTFVAYDAVDQIGPLKVGRNAQTFQQQAATNVVFISPVPVSLIMLKQAYMYSTGRRNFDISTPDGGGSIINQIARVVVVE